MTHQLKITLADSEPEVWRRVLVASDITLANLHTVIQQAMGWENVNDYRFTLGVGQAPQNLQQTLGDIECQRLYYTYDSKSGWLHRIEIERSDAETNKRLPVCLAGESACPPEGTGGVWGYDELLARLEDTDDPDYLDLIDKYSSFDPDTFDLKAANERLNQQ